MIERVIVLPKQDNDGVSLRGVILSIESELLSIAGGLSKSSQQGAWRDEGHTYRDKSWRYVLAVDESQDAQIVARLPEWCAALRQVCLYTSAAQVAVSFVYPAVEVGAA